MRGRFNKILSICFIVIAAIALSGCGSGLCTLRGCVGSGGSATYLYGFADPVFGTNGVLTFNTGTSETIYSIKAMSDGTFVTAGMANAGAPGANWNLMKFSSSGLLVNTFGTAGIVNLDFGGLVDDYAYDLVELANGKFIVVGYSRPGGVRQATWGQFNSNGSSDTAFGTSGFIYNNLVGSADNYFRAKLQADGNLIAGGYSTSGNDISSITRVSGNGLDTAYGTSGISTLDLTGIGNASRARDVLPLSNGKTIVVGTATLAGFYNRFMVARLNTDGSLDGTFGTGGLVHHNLSGANQNVNRGILLSSGKIMIVGTAMVSGSQNLAVVRLNSDGSLDLTFNGTGYFLANPYAQQADAAALVELPNGKVIVAGTAYDGINNMAMSLQLKTDGTLDTAYGTNGYSYVVCPGWATINDVIYTNNSAYMVGTDGNDSLIVRLK